LLEIATFNYFIFANIRAISLFHVKIFQATTLMTDLIK